MSQNHDKLIRVIGRWALIFPSREFRNFIIDIKFNNLEAKLDLRTTLILNQFQFVINEFRRRRSSRSNMARAAAKVISRLMFLVSVV